MVQGKHPLPSVILCESRESRNTFSQEWLPLCAFSSKEVTMVSGREWPRVTKVQGKHPSPSIILCESRESRNTIRKESNPPTAVGWA